ncbi:MAG: peptide chain release factor 1 [Pseudomonadota bacterium]|jgi:peptide chain release factor 1
MFSKLSEVESRYEEVNLQLQRPDVASNQTQYRSLMKELSNLEKVVSFYRGYKKKKQDHESNIDLLQGEKDPEMRELLKEEIKQLELEIPAMEDELKILLLPKDPNNDKNVLVEIRAGTGGDEASLFADELFRAYTQYSQKQGWSVKLLSMSEGNVGGVKEVIASVSGDGVYGRLKVESGVHRVQRVPKTETQGRIHTSTVTVAIIPEQEETELKIDPKDLRIDVTRSQGAGGQSVNTTDSAVRVTHLPTGIIVFCQEGKSQLGNREQAMKILYSKLAALEEEKKRKEASETRLAQIGSGDRSERIRTYNFPQSRITDHRIGLTIHQIDAVMSGELELLIDPILAYFQAEALKNQSQ